MASSRVVLNFLSWWLRISTLSLLCINDFLSHSVAWVAGSMINGVLTEFKIIIAFSIERSSAGKPSFLKVKSWASVARNVLMLKASTRNPLHQFARCYSLEVSFSPPRYVIYALDNRDLIGTRAISLWRVSTWLLHLSFSPPSCWSSFWAASRVASAAVKRASSSPASWVFCAKFWFSCSVAISSSWSCALHSSTLC